MAVEIKNYTRALGMFTPNDPPVFINGSGVDPATLERTAAGRYRLQLLEAVEVVTSATWILQGTMGANIGAGFILDCSIGDGFTTGVFDELLFTVRLDDGTLSDGGGVVMWELKQLPTQN